MSLVVIPMLIFKQHAAIQLDKKELVNKIYINIYSFRNFFHKKNTPIPTVITPRAKSEGSVSVIRVVTIMQHDRIR